MENSTGTELRSAGACYRVTIDSFASSESEDFKTLEEALSFALTEKRIFNTISITLLEGVAMDESDDLCCAASLAIIFFAVALLL